VDTTPTIRIGTSGWIYRHWRGLFYPATLPTPRWFAFYAGRLDTVEINNTSYRLPGPEAFDARRRQAAAGFLHALELRDIVGEVLSPAREPVPYA
jgi:uncharacterized protein YecE (DUF72 family)